LTGITKLGELTNFDLNAETPRRIRTGGEGETGRNKELYKTHGSAEDDI